MYLVVLAFPELWYPLKCCRISKYLSPSPPPEGVSSDVIWRGGAFSQGPFLREENLGASWPEGTTLLPTAFIGPAT